MSPGDLKKMKVDSRVDHAKEKWTFLPRSDFIAQMNELMTPPRQERMSGLADGAPS